MQIISQIIKQSLVNWKSLKWLQSSKLKDIGEHGITKLKNSLKENNFVQPFNVWEDSKGVIWILDGHHREKALTQLEAEGYEIPEMLPANFIECSDKKAAAKMVLLYSSIYAKITNEGLGEFLDDFDLDISNLINEIDLPGLDFDSILEPEALPEDIDEAPQPLEKTYSILGDVFEIDGKHRVMCGDSTKESDVSILMNGNKADMVFTDPPYGVDYSGGIQFTNEGVKKEQRQRLTDDHLGTDIYESVIPILADNCDGAIYTWFSDTKALPVYLAVNSVGEIHSLLIWKKNGGYGALNSNYKQKHEPCLYWKSKKGKLNFVGATTETTIWEIDKDGVNKLHPTQKPVALALKAIQNHKSNIVLDLFLGSGSTLIAAETTKRICYGMEIDQHYSDVILRRYKKTFPNASFKCLTRNDFPFEELFNA